MLTTESQTVTVALGIFIFLAASRKRSLGIYVASGSSLTSLDHANSRRTSHQGNCGLNPQATTAAAGAFLMGTLYLGTAWTCTFKGSGLSQPTPCMTLTRRNRHHREQMTAHPSGWEANKEPGNQNLLWGRSGVLGTYSALTGWHLPGGCSGG